MLPPPVAGPALSSASKRPYSTRMGWMAPHWDVHGRGHSFRSTPTPPGEGVIEPRLRPLEPYARFSLATRHDHRETSPARRWHRASRLDSVDATGSCRSAGHSGSNDLATTAFGDRHGESWRRHAPDRQRRWPRRKEKTLLVSRTEGWATVASPSFRNPVLRRHCSESRRPCGLQGREFACPSVRKLGDDGRDDVEAMVAWPSDP
jgi:hypothetical protein